MFRGTGQPRHINPLRQHSAFATSNSHGTACKRSLLTRSCKDGGGPRQAGLHARDALRPGLQHRSLQALDFSPARCGEAEQHPLTPHQLSSCKLHVCAPTHPAQGIGRLPVGRMLGKERGLVVPCRLRRGRQGSVAVRQLRPQLAHGRLCHRPNLVESRLAAWEGDGAGLVVRVCR